MGTIEEKEEREKEETSRNIALILNPYLIVDGIPRMHTPRAVAKSISYFVP